MKQKEYRILILTSDAGLGHRSAAEAIRDAIRNKYCSHCIVNIANPFNHPKIPEFIRKSQSNYDEIVKVMPKFYEFSYDISNAKIPMKLMEGGFTMLFFQVLKEMLNEFTPNLVITTYPTYSAPLSVIYKIENIDIPWITVVTDLMMVHHMWFNTGAAVCAVSSKSVKELALGSGLSADKIIETGIPVNPQISVLKYAKKKDLRDELGWEKQMISVLVVGSSRVKALHEFVRTMDKSNHQIQFALVAGGDQDLYNCFQEINLDHPKKVYDFVDFLPKLMRASDLVVCKAGGLIVSESLASGLPVLLVHMLPGQEEGNVYYVLEHQTGAFCKTPQEALRILNQWLDSDGAELKKLSQNAAKIGRPNAAYQIAQKAYKLLNP